MAARIDRAFEGAAARQGAVEMRAQMDALSTLLKGLRPDQSVTGGHAALGVNRDGTVTRWVAVGGNGLLSPGTFSATASLVNYGINTSDANSKDGRLNCGYPQKIFAYMANAPHVYAAGLGEMGSLRGDVRPLMLKTKLYDQLRVSGMGFPTGVEWAVPLKHNAVMEVFSRSILDAWEYRVTVIDASVLDLACREGALAVGEEVWILNTPTVAVVVLDETGGNNPTLWGLQVLTALPYPLAGSVEYYVVNGWGHAQEDSLRGFMRTESLVSMRSRVKDMILVVNRTTTSIRVCDVDFVVATVNRGGGYQAAFGNATPLIHACLNRVLKEERPLCTVYQQWLNRRTTGLGIDWAEIDILADLLCVRWVQQLEVMRTGWGGLERYGLPFASKRRYTGAYRLSRREQRAIMGNTTSITAL